ncbi:MAG: lysozyme [Marinilabiliales bacterium]|nr:lysozyme [Marinilabiliales bacterium]
MTCPIRNSWWIPIRLTTMSASRCTDALVSFAYNVGLNALKGLTLLQKVNANPADPAIKGQFERWVYGGGKVLPGLVRRRKASFSGSISKGRLNSIFKSEDHG